MRKVWPNQSDLSTNSAGQIPPIGHPEAPVSTSSPSACHQKAGYGYSELPPRRLGPRHRKILDLLVLGRTNKEIARHLGISPNTVRNRLLEIFRSTACLRGPNCLARFWIVKRWRLKSTASCKLTMALEIHGNRCTKPTERFHNEQARRSRHSSGP